MSWMRWEAPSPESRLRRCGHNLTGGYMVIRALGLVLEVVVPEDDAVGSRPIPFCTCKSTCPGVWLSNLITPSSRTTLPATLLTHSELFMVSSRLCAWQLKERQREIRALSHPVLTASAPSQEHSDIYRGPSLYALSSVSPCPSSGTLSPGHRFPKGRQAPRSWGK